MTGGIEEPGRGPKTQEKPDETSGNSSSADSGGGKGNDRTGPFIGVGLLLMVGVFSYFAAGRRFDHTAALYIGIPALIAFSLAAQPRSDSAMGSGLKWLTILLVLAVPVLKEGFVCIVLASPILYAVTAMVCGLLDWSARDKTKGTRNLLLLIPVIATIEGSHPLLSVEREVAVVRERVVAADLTQIEAQLGRPLKIQRPLPLFTRLFPPPVEITGAGAATGDIRRMRFVYYKWFYWNAHEGEVEFRIERPAAGVIRYVPVRDTSYIGSYLRWKNAELHLLPDERGGTNARLTITYERDIDPAWYFGTLMTMTVGYAADIMLDNGVIPIEARGR